MGHGHRARIASALAFFVCVALAAMLPRAATAQVAAGTQFTLFWRGDLRIIATRPNTQITILDAATGLPLAGFFTANIAGNPVDLRNAGDSLEANNGTATFRIRVIAEASRGPREDKPIIVWTGFLEAGLKHPAAPPTATNAWMSNLPALAAGSVENGSELGREFWGFTSRELLIIARKGPSSTSILVDDIATNVELDTDDSQVLNLASPYLAYSDAEIEVYYMESFEDDTLHLMSNVDMSVTVGIGSRTGNDWTISPPSFGAGEDARELGTLFYTYVSRDLTIFPTQDNTNVTITDLSDGDDSMSFALREGNLIGDYDLYTVDTFARSGTGITPRPASPAVRLTTGGASAPFENDFVKVESDRPVLVYVGPKAADTFEYADVAYTVRTGPTSFLNYVYAQNGGAEDLQIFAYASTTGVSITSLTTTTGFRGGVPHDFLIPTVTPWQGGNGITNDYYWGSGVWSGELLRIQSDGPLSVIGGDYDGANYGCFIPFVADSGLLRPIADAGPDIFTCPGQTSVTLDGRASFDADFTDGVLPETFTWDVDPLVDSDGDTVGNNDANLVGSVVTFNLIGPGPWTVTLTFTDNDGQSDTDVVVILNEDTQPPLLDCPVSVVAPGDGSGTGFANVLATVTDNCDPFPIVTNDRTAGGRDASDTYPCGDTIVTFSAFDAQGNTTTCVTRVTITDPQPPVVDCPIQVDGVADDTGLALLVFGATASDLCDPAPALINDRTASGADATDSYPCGDTFVTFTATDAGGQTGSCVTLVRVADVTAPVLTCPPDSDVPATSLLGAFVAVLADARDVCDPSVTVSNDRTSGGADASDTYPCGKTTVTFVARDAAGIESSCMTAVTVSPLAPPSGISPALRVHKIDGQDARTVVRLHWETAPVLEPWQEYEVRRTATDEVRPYPVLAAGVTTTEHVDASAAGQLWYYQVHVVDCAGERAPDPLALSP